MAQISERVTVLAQRLADIMHTQGVSNMRYYMIDRSHPAITPLWLRYCAANCIVERFPASDTERLIFELSLYNSGTLSAIEEYCNNAQVPPTAARNGG